MRQSESKSTLIQSQMEAERGSFEKSTKEISATNMKTQAELT